MSLVAMPGREKERSHLGKAGKGNETTWQGIRTFGKPQAKGLVGIVEEGIEMGI